MDVHLRIVGGFEAGQVVPEENTGNRQNNERGKKDETLVRAPLWIRALRGIRLCGG